MPSAQVDITTGEVLDTLAPESGEQTALTRSSVNVLSYPDCLANVFDDSNESLRNLDATGFCGRYSSVGSCPDGRHYRKVLLCGRDWCHDCGAPWSDIHRRRFARWLPKVQQIDRLGYLVVTLPEDARPRTQLEWGLMGSYVVDVLKDFGFCRGVRRWHWFGELWVAYWKQLEPQLDVKDARQKFEDRTTEDARRDGVTPTWHPHLNVLVDGDDVPRRKADFLEWAANLRAALSAVLLCQVNVHYEYADADAQKTHITKYVLRGTFLDSSWDPDMATDLHGFRNSREWGSPADWSRPALWQMTDADEIAGDQDEKISEQLVTLHNGNCPDCLQPVRWTGIERTFKYRERVVEDYGGGYYRVRLDVFDAWDAEGDHDTS